MADDRWLTATAAELLRSDPEIAGELLRSDPATAAELLRSDPETAGDPCLLESVRLGEYLRLETADKRLSLACDDVEEFGLPLLRPPLSLSAMLGDPESLEVDPPKRGEDVRELRREVSP